MRQLAREPRNRPDRYAATSYRALWLSEGRTYPRDIGEPESLKAAVDAAKTWCFHKDHLVIVETDKATGKSSLHIYAIKRKSTPTYEFRDHKYHRINTLYADPVCVLDAAALDRILNTPDPLEVE